MDSPAPKSFISQHRKGYERALLATIWGGLAATVAGGLVILLQPLFPELDAALLMTGGLWLTSGGFALAGTSVVLSRPIRSLRRAGSTASMGESYQRARYWTRLKVTSILLNLLGIVGALIVLAALLGRVGVFSLDALAGLPVATSLHVPTILAVALGLNVAYAHHLSLKIARERPQMGLEGAFTYLGVAAGAVLGLMAGVLSMTELTLPWLGQLTTDSASVFLLASATSVAAALFVSRSLPSLYALFTDEREFYKGPTHLSRSKSVVMPTAIAFALLFAVVLVVIVFELSVVGMIDQVPKNSVLLGILGFIVVAMAASIWVSLSLSKSEDRTSLYKEKRSKEAKTEIAILAVSGFFVFLFFAAGAALFAGKSVLGLSQERWIDLVVFGLFAAVTPYGFYHAKKQKRIRQLEERFPDFLRDLAASRKAGLTLESAVTIAARGEYGALTPDIQKMADQLSWNVTFEDALMRFAERVRTPLVERSVSLIIEAGRSGGQVTDVLHAAARDAREIKNLETERRLTMTLYTAIVYIAFLVFLGVAAVLYGTFIPEVLKASQAALAAGSSGIGGISFSTLTLADYRTFYFVAAIAQALGNGIIAGLMENSDPLNGLRHSSVMLLISYVVFAVALG